MFTKQLLYLGFSNVSGSIHLFENRLNNLSLFGGGGSTEKIEIYLEPIVDVPMYYMVSVAQFPWRDTLLESPCLTCRSVFVGSTDIHSLVTF